MRLGSTVAVLTAFAIIVQGMASASVPDPGSPRYANSILSDFSTPTVAPGESLVFAFNISNPYEGPLDTMTNVTITVGIYRYATQEELRDLDDDFENPPVFDDGSTEKTIEVDLLPLDGTERISLDIKTSRRTPHGSYFMQSTYFVRFCVMFNFEGNDTVVVLKSKGCFSDDEWDQMVSFDPEESLVNVSYMKDLGVDGLIPDSSFGLKIPIPRWPLGLLIGGCGFVSFVALYYFVLDNPGKYPKLEKRFYKLRGKLGEFRSKLQNFLRKG
ncbi:MAG: hypothetical protein JSV94_03835 [Methanobacteriota archaeon]|nr:MAG: hypothetical protein JSV94_03835 [Euryarchaeota archaeon]